MQYSKVSLNERAAEPDPLVAIEAKSNLFQFLHCEICYKSGF